MRIRLPVCAASVIEVYSEEDWTDEDADLEALCALYREQRSSRLRVPTGQGPTIARALIQLSNLYGDMAEGLAPMEGSKAFCRAAERGLSTAAKVALWEW